VEFALQHWDVSSKREKQSKATLVSVVTRGLVLTPTVTMDEANHRHCSSPWTTRHACLGRLHTWHQATVDCPPAQLQGLNSHEL
jgi:hypothetical protein